MFRVVMRFGGVFSLRLSDFGGGRTQVSGFFLDDISERGWEHGRLEVGDYEDQRIHFFAATVEICSVEAFEDSV